MSKFNLALIGFEFEHHVSAAGEALDRLRKHGLEFKLSLWSARDGIKKDVLRHFPDCTFADAGLGWLGRKKNERQLNNSPVSTNLSDLEIKHFSYAYSRTTFFRDPRKIKDTDVKFYINRVANASIELYENNISVVFFVKLPHSIDDLAYFYAAKRLKLNIAYTDGPFFGDYVFPVISHQIDEGARAQSTEGRIDFNVMMDSRNLNKTMSLPHYMTHNLDYMPSVPRTITPFFRTQAEAALFEITRSMFISKSIRHVLTRISDIFSRTLRWYARVNICKTPNLENKYILVLLQYQPEQTTSPSASDTPFEEERIRELSKKFSDYSIVVREHPSNVKSTTYTYNQYRSIKSLAVLSGLKNVFYVFPGTREEYKKLIEGSFFTVSTSGTVALESIQLGVPSIHFYKSFAHGFPGIICVSCVDEVTIELIEKQSHMLKSISNDELIALSYESMCKRPLIRGFLCGYHQRVYSKLDYVKNAADIIYATLSSIPLKSRNGTPKL